MTATLGERPNSVPNPNTPKGRTGLSQRRRPLRCGAATVGPCPNAAPTAVKICGVTTLSDAELACSLGAWAVGMIFYEPSPRRCSIEQAAVICARLRRRVELCGVFVNAAPDFVASTAEQLGLTLLQLHGDEGPSIAPSSPAGPARA